MSSVLDRLPNNVEALKSLVVDHAARNEQLAAENRQYKSQVVLLQEQLNIALAKRFASRSEQLSPDQIRLFDEAESTACAETEVVPEESVAVSAHRRKKGGRKPLPERLPRIEVVHELPEHERRCDHDGRLLSEVGEVVSEQLDIVPAKIQVLRHIRKQYACDCGQCIKDGTAPCATDPQEYGLAGLAGAHYSVQVRRCVTAVPSGEDITAHRCGYPPSDAGELDDTGGSVSATAD